MPLPIAEQLVEIPIQQTADDSDDSDNEFNAVEFSDGDEEEFMSQSEDLLADD